jgi:hypothetical protein
MRSAPATRYSSVGSRPGPSGTAQIRHPRAGTGSGWGYYGGGGRHGGGHHGGGYYGGGHHGGYYKGGYYPYRGGHYYRPYYGYGYYRPYYSGYYGWPYFSLYLGWPSYYGWPSYGAGYGGSYASSYTYAPSYYSGDEAPPSSIYDERSTEPPPARSRETSRSYPRGETGQLRLEVRPEDTSVYVDDEFRGTARDARILDLSPGRHRIELVRPGFAIEHREVEVVKGERADLMVELRRP